MRKHGEKHSVEYIRNDIENIFFPQLELKWIDGEYKNNNSILVCIDKFGFKYGQPYANLRGRHLNNGEPSKTRGNPFAVENIQNQLNILGITNINVLDYSNKKAKILCEHEHISDISLSHLYERKRCPECNKYREITINTVIEEFDKLNYIVASNEYNNNTTMIDYICKKHPEEGTQSSVYANVIASQGGCKKCGIEKTISKITKSSEKFELEFYEKFKNRFTLLSEYRNSRTDVVVMCNKCRDVFERMPKILLRDKTYCPNCETNGEYANGWDGGKTEIRMLGREISHKIFREKTFKESNYKCAITGSTSIEAHHIYNYHKIFKETISEVGILFEETVGELTREKRDDFVKLMSLRHMFLDGITLNKKLHKLFHSLYGKKNNDYGQMAMFIHRLLSGEFLDYLKENNLSLSPNYEVLKRLNLITTPLHNS